jgi:hypothetical protein
MGNQGHETDAAYGLEAIAYELKRESDRLRQLAEELQRREQLDAEMHTN